MDRTRPFGFWSFIVFVSSLLGAGASTAGGRQRPSFRTEVDVVDVSRIAWDRRGRYVEDLTRHDFHPEDPGQAGAVRVESQAS